MALRKVIRCKACWSGDCPDCSRWTDAASKCEHNCDAIPRQLALPWVTGSGTPAAPAIQSRPASPVAGLDHQEEKHG